VTCLRCRYCTQCGSSRTYIQNTKNTTWERVISSQRLWQQGLYWCQFITPKFDACLHFSS